MKKIFSAFVIAVCCMFMAMPAQGQVEMNGEQCAIARTPDDLSRLKTEGKKAFYIGIENGYGIGKDLKNITRFHDAFAV